jgi:hypothetical protein
VAAQISITIKEREQNIITYIYTGSNCMKHKNTQQYDMEIKQTARLYLLKVRASLPAPPTPPNLGPALFLGSGLKLVYHGQA